MGGAVPNLIEELIAQNEIDTRLDLYCCSLWNPLAQQQSVKYSNTHFIWAKKPAYIRYADKGLYWVVKHIFRLQRLISVSFLFQVVWYMCFIARLLHKNTYDYVIFENSVPLLFALKLFGNRQKYKGKYFIHMHSVPRHYYTNASVFAQAKKIICVSQYVATAIKNDARLYLTKNNLVVMYNCINTDWFNSDSPSLIDSSRKQFNLSQNPLLVFVGRLCPEKGIEELLQAFSLITQPRVDLLVVGANFYKSDIVSPYEGKLRQLAQPFAERIHFTGYISYEQMPAIYHLADIIVLPSMWEEPAGMTILEAMACKKPVITTYSGGIPEYTGEGNCILLKRNENLPKELAAHIDLLLTNQDLAQTLSEKAAARAAHYTTKYYYQQFLNILADEEKTCDAK